MNTLRDTNLPTRVVDALSEQGIASIETLMQFSLDDIRELEGIGPKALVQIAKVRDAQTMLNTQADEAAQAPVSQKYMTEEPPEDKRTPDGEELTVKLKFRHAEWVKNAADTLGTTPEHVIEQAVRAACAKDHSKGGTAMNSGTVLKHDNPFANQQQG